MIEPTTDHIAVVLDAKENRLPSGLFLPDQAVHPVETAVVVAVGPGRWTEKGALIPVGVEVGDRVLMDGGFAGSKVKHDDVEYIVLREMEILAVLS